MKAKPDAETKLKLLLQTMYDPHDGPANIMEINSVVELTASNGFKYIPKATDVSLFLCYLLFAYP